MALINCTVCELFDIMMDMGGVSPHIGILPEGGVPGYIGPVTPSRTAAITLSYVEFI
jgi:hypothetical protein